MIYSLTKATKGSNVLHPHSTYYTDEYANSVCNLYLKDEFVRDETGHVRKNYRLHAHDPHNEQMAFAYDIDCPCCGARLKQIGRQLTYNTLGLYTCPACNKH